MRYRPLGASGIQASVVGFGAWAIGGWLWGGQEEKAAVRAVQAALDAGIDLIDTAPAYGLGASEQVIGKAIAGRRDKVVLATKCGLTWHTARGTLFFEEFGKPVHKFLGPDSIRTELEDSLRRLKTDRIDLYQTHWQDSTTPNDATMAELVRLKEQGKIRAIGVSNVTVEQLAAYRKDGEVASVQEKYSMLDRGHEKDLLPYCREHNVAFLAYSPLAQGLLTGKVGLRRRFRGDDQRRGHPRFSAENRAKVVALLKEFQPVAERHGVSLTQLAIAWTVAQPGVTHALVGARKPGQAGENARGGEVALTAADLKAMSAALRRCAADIA